MRYFNEQNEYKEPTLIKFEQPKIIKLSQLREFLDQYKPFACADVYLYEKFEYGDYDNWVEAIIRNKTIDASFSQVHRKPLGIFKKGQTRFTLKDDFWYYKEDYPFWLDCPTEGYNDGYKNICRYIDKVEICVEGVYVISWSDKQKIESKYKNK